MNYKVGDCVRIKSIDWYNKNKDELEEVDCGYHKFTNEMTKFCGHTMTVCKRTTIGVMTMDDNDYCWTDEMIEGLAEEETNQEDVATTVGTKIESTGFMQMGKIVSVIFNNENYEDEVELQLGDYEITVRDSKTYAIRKKPKYPTTYEECCKVLSLGEDGRLYTKGYKASLIQNFQKLLICRDAYWKIAGEEMGLGKPWEPGYKTLDDNTYFTIHTFNGEIKKSATSHRNSILAFPTEEMRDMFYKNFKKDIERCKELL